MREPASGAAGSRDPERETADEEGPTGDDGSPPSDRLGARPARESAEADADVSNRPQLPPEVLETSRLLVEFVHVAEATRRTALPAGDSLPLSPNASRAAMYIYQFGNRTVGQIAQGLRVSYGWASRVIEELEQAGYVARERDAIDHRIVRLRLEPAALEAVERAYRWRAEAIGRALDPLTPGERAAVRAFLEQAIALLSRAVSEHD